MWNVGDVEKQEDFTGYGERNEPLRHSLHYVPPPLSWAAFGADSLPPLKGEGNRRGSGGVWNLMLRWFLGYGERNEKHPSRGIYIGLQWFLGFSRATLFFKEGFGAKSSESKNNPKKAKIAKGFLI